MRKIDYLSPTSIKSFMENPREFYMNYLCEKRPPRGIQTPPMAAGSALDAYAKSYLHEKLFGKGHDPRFDFQTLFEAQVESQNRDWALVMGKYLFLVYTKTGALTDLMLDLQSAIGTPRFEFEVRGVVDGYREGVTKDVSGVVLLGKPDIYFTNKHGCHNILDFKVNGACSNSNVSPMPGYIRLRGLDNKTGDRHKKCLIGEHRGTYINIGDRLEDLNEDWALQLTIYAWLCGAEVGDQFICAVDQFACNGGIKINYSGIEVPECRVAEHRLRVREDYQYKLFATIQGIWEAVHSDHIFREVSQEESQDLCSQLDVGAAALRGEGTDIDKWMFESTKRKNLY